jgi:hypothetical protein
MKMEEQINKLIHDEVESRVLSIKKTNSYLQEQVVKLNKDIEQKKTLIIELSKGDLFSKYAKNINKDNIGKYLGFVFDDCENPCNNNQTTKASEWFYNIVKYWNHKKEILEIYDIAGIKYNKWILNFKMPYEWNQSQCDLFIKYIGNQYVCNGAIFDSNYGFWQEQCCNKTIEQNIIKQYSQIPWQLVLKNKLWLKAENFEKILSIVNDGNHGRYFTKIHNYQKLSSKQIERMVRKLLKNPALKSSGRCTEKESFSELLTYVDVESQLMYDVFNSGVNLPYGLEEPKEIKIKKIMSINDAQSRAKAMINSGLFTNKAISTTLLKK